MDVFVLTHWLTFPVHPRKSWFIRTSSTWIFFLYCCSTLFFFIAPTTICVVFISPSLRYFRDRSSRSFIHPEPHLSFAQRKSLKFRFSLQTKCISQLTGNSKRCEVSFRILFSFQLCFVKCLTPPVHIVLILKPTLSFLIVYVPHVYLSKFDDVNSRSLMMCLK